MTIEKLKSALYEQAVDAVERGWTIIPLSVQSKKPLNEWKHYQTSPTMMDEVDEWFDVGAPTTSGNRVSLFNLALITGDVSGVVVLDCDNQAAVDYAKKNNLVSPFAVKTTRGMHFYFNHPRGGKKFANKVGGTSYDWPKIHGLDLRGDGGYVVMPPSVRVDDNNNVTHTYEWELGYGLGWDDLEDFVWKGSPTEVSVAAVTFETLDLSHVDVITGDVAMSVEEQAAQRVAVLGRKLQEGDGTDSWMVRYCGQKVRQGILGEDLEHVVRNFYAEYFEDEFNPEATTRWLEAKMRSAIEMDRRNYPDDYDADGNRAKKDEPKPVETSRLVPIYADAVDRLLSEMKDEVYWVNPLIPEGTITQVVGFNGHGKSFFLASLLTSMAAGRGEFGPYETPKPAKIFYMDYDNPRRTTLRRLRDFNKTYGYTNEHYALWSPTLISAEDGGEMDLMTPAGVRLLGDWLDVVKPDILVIDTIRNAFRGLEETSPTEWAKVNYVAKLVRNTGVSVVLVHHRNKPGDTGLGREAGSTAQLTDVDTQVFVTQVFQDKTEAKSKAGLLDADLSVYTLEGKEYTPYGYLMKHAGDNTRVQMVTQISFGKVRQQTELHETHYIGWCESLVTGDKFIVSTKSKKQKALHLRTKGFNAYDVSREIKVPQDEIRNWFGLEAL